LPFNLKNPIQQTPQTGWFSTAPLWLVLNRPVTKIQHAGKESLTQAIGRAVAAAGGSGLLARSAGHRHGVNVVIFPKAHLSDHLEVVEGDKLDQLAGTA
jgi:hypothetical protein